MKSVLISIQPKWCELIASGKKTVEVRKTAPKSQTPFKCYIYDTKGTFDITLCPDLNAQSVKVADKGRGKVIGEFVCDNVEQFTVGSLRCDDIEKLACLSYREMLDYFYRTNELDGKTVKFGYAWHISNFEIYDKPKELSEFFRPVKYNADGPIFGTEQEMEDIYEWDCETVFNKKSTECTLKDCQKLQELYRVTTPPQSWCYVENES